MVLLFTLGEMDIEELRAKYAAAYDSDFEMPRDSGDESTDIGESDEDDDEEAEEEETTEFEETEGNCLGCKDRG